LIEDKTAEVKTLELLFNFAFYIVQYTLVIITVISSLLRQRKPTEFSWEWPPLRQLNQKKLKRRKK
jgi:hypothetical protein